ncbi:sensor domain-containing phosphodiesterase [Tenuibacillus multivorans]|uniref:PAS domain S-box-containing protein n=1 Tax=Tenuibacillus multivorans TaxID=237069 RepID=A0A1H0BT87_9BACI|nr:EAL domain-containing protein [Tenuibacillus multivorans]GEL77045.1 hypothetical protein TMU01_12800 [Tenuibacillus multivorans]SDN48810.1 PAS domain S-box-containing protein [Tenuibacillus multivorans]
MEHDSLYFIDKQDLEMALQKQEFYIVYQPQFDLTSGRVTGMETLIRWNHSKWGSVSPDEFIPLAEDSGMMHDITKWVLKKACWQNQKWQNRGLPKMKVAVNISPVDFEMDELYDVVVKVLDETGLNPVYLELEITETAIIKDVENTIKTLEKLSKTGVSIAIDDFGTGNASLAYIRDLPIHKVKIDRSFMKEIPYHKKNSSIVKDIIEMCHNLNLDIVAEGVETEEEVIFLSLYQCTIAQGFLFGHPMLAEETEKEISTCENHAMSLIYRLEDRINLGSAKMNEHRFESLFNQNPDLVCSFGLNRKFLSVNPAIEKILGYKSQDVLNNDIMSFIYSEDIGIVDQCFNKILYGNNSKPIDIRLIHKQGDLVYCNVTSFPIRLGQRIVGIYSVIKDVTSQKKLEEALHESQRKYKLLTENMSDLLSLVRADGVIQYASPSHETVLGENPNFIEGKSFLDFVFSEDVERAKEEFRQILNTKQPRYIVVRTSGEPIWMEVQGTPVLNDDGTLSYILFVSRDISEREKVLDMLG